MEYVAIEWVRCGAVQPIKADLPRVVTGEHRERAANNGTHISRKATSSSSDKSEVDEKEDPSHNLRATMRGAAKSNLKRSVPHNANTSARTYVRTIRAHNLTAFALLHVAHLGNECEEVRNKK